MGHITSIGAGIYSDLSVSVAVVAAGTVPATLDQAGFDAEFLLETTDYTRITNVREFPAMGTPPNVVNVPVYGQATSQQIQGQSDAPSMEIQLNYVADDWDDASTLGGLVGDGNQYVFRFALLISQPPGYDTQYVAVVSVSIIAGNTADTTDTTTQNSYYYWIGKIEALQVTPQLTDANTATITITVQSDFYGAYTTAPNVAVS